MVGVSGTAFKNNEQEKKTMKKKTKTMKKFTYDLYPLPSASSSPPIHLPCSLNLRCSKCFVGFDFLPFQKAI
jgi:hypothetical protein